MTCLLHLSPTSPSLEPSLELSSIQDRLVERKDGHDRSHAGCLGRGQPGHRVQVVCSSVLHRLGNVDVGRGIMIMVIIFVSKSLGNARHVVELREDNILQQMVPPAKEKTSHCFTRLPLLITDMNKQGRELFSLTLCGEGTFHLLSQARKVCSHRTAGNSGPGRAPSAEVRSRRLLVW